MILQSDKKAVAQIVSQEATVASTANASGNDWDSDDRILYCLENLEKAEDTAFLNEFTVNKPLNSAQEMVIA